MPPAHAHNWRALEPLPEPEALASMELRAFERLWAEQRARLTASGTYDSFWERVARRWSIETGIIERIYDVSLGATRLLIEQGFSASLLQHADSNLAPDHLIAILDDHKAGLEHVMDLIGGRRELSPGWIKELHAVLCHNQGTVSAVEQGPLKRALEIKFEHGSYKRLPNSPTLEDGSVHEYPPPEHVASEVESMLAHHAALPADLPEVRSAWLHWAFTHTHPFQDGNGRVARALASIDFIRAGLFPLVVERDDRNSAYFPALRAADRGNLQPLVAFFAKCQSRSVVQAISTAEAAITSSKGRMAAIQAAREKVEARLAASGAERRRIMLARMHELILYVEAVFHSTAIEIRNTVPGVSSSVMSSTPATEHYWTQQLVQIAKARSYWADLREPRVWARLSLRNGATVDVVVAIHFVGNPSPGSSMCSAFLVHRDEKDTPVHQARFTILPVEPLLLVAEEEPREQRTRFGAWLTDAEEIALHEWRRSL